MVHRMGSRAGSWLTVAVLGVVGMSCGDGYDVDTTVTDCAGHACDFQGSAAARAMVARGDSETGEWHGWLGPLRSEIARTGVGRWSACEGDVTTATYTGRSPTVPPVVLTIARWRDGALACTGRLSVDNVEVPLPPGLLPGPGDVVPIPLPEEGASFEISV